MELPKGRRGSHMVMILSGIILSCVLQLGAAQRRISIILEPPKPQEGQDVTLSVQGGPQQLKLCEWSRDIRKGGLETILEYNPNKSPQQRNGTAFSGRETVRADCSLRITKLRQSDEGNYSVIIEGASTRQQPPQKPDQEPDEFFEGSVYLQVSVSNQITITVLSTPQQPNEGQQVTLTPQGIPKKFELCEWFKQGAFGNLRPITSYKPNDQQNPQSTDPGSKGRLSVREDCSLHITQLTTSDSGTYIVQIQVLSDRQQQQPGQETRPQEPGVPREYRGQVELQVKAVSSKDPQKGGHNHSAGLNYSAGVIAGALLGVFAWTDTLTSLFYGLCATLSWPGRLL
ncbi:carcinoembryonic antigen-related cell adhesion molecule 19-like isoform X2 [Eublepharis macularius]|uniref:Carcinoembryonic antigen-related cell adhesion molecule 19-like isoform X2 n=1 Tax=Eublepharis macularius TaxID=481883 RepID=A0AA97KAY0_EUBMA|nr:carcinoembryonic antigen-related cell adhesion molecule 19-like isoform X2 [Eublepharis macularius]